MHLEHSEGDRDEDRGGAHELECSAADVETAEEAIARAEDQSNPLLAVAVQLAQAGISERHCALGQAALIRPSLDLWIAGP